LTTRGPLRPILAFLLFGMLGCSLLVDTSDLERGCGEGWKLCGVGHCVQVNDPAYGCTREHCQPCALSNAIPACSGETCTVSACLFGFDCPNELGCPVNTLVEIDNCGACGKHCDSGQTCRDGRCEAR